MIGRNIKLPFLVPFFFIPSLKFRCGTVCIRKLLLNLAVLACALVSDETYDLSAYPFPLPSCFSTRARSSPRNLLNFIEVLFPPNPIAPQLGPKVDLAGDALSVEEFLSGTEIKTFFADIFTWKLFFSFHSFFFLLYFFIFYLLRHHSCFFCRIF